MKCVYVHTDLYMKLHTELGRLCTDISLMQVNIAEVAFIFLETSYKIRVIL